jgi:hypothetical protein
MVSDYYHKLTNGDRQDRILENKHTPQLIAACSYQARAISGKFEIVRDVNNKACRQAAEGVYPNKTPRNFYAKGGVAKVGFEPTT